MTPQDFEATLKQTLDDRRLTRGERKDLAGRIAEAALDDPRRALFRHQAFDVARAALQGCGPEAAQVLDWLEEVNKLLLPPTGDGAELFCEAHFSPGEACVRRITGLLDQARKSADLCVFTITDDRIARSILAARDRGVAMRVITDNDKAFDAGSDVPELLKAGVPLLVDRTEYHMHHKFALFDGGLLLTGSYNWTRGAAVYNEENLVVSNDRRLVGAFAREFEKLWNDLSRKL